MGTDHLSGLGQRLERIYGVPQRSLEHEIRQLVELYRVDLPTQSPVEETHLSELSQRDVVLITYADQLRSGDRSPLATLNQFLHEQQLEECVNTVHLLPFFPYSSDDGFSVIDYLKVAGATGDWDDVASLTTDFRLMFDLVLNHVSVKHEWFQKYLQGQSPFNRFFIELPPHTDLSQVTRPRSHPLLTPFTTSRGTKHVWTTFSEDQVDLNYSEPQVLRAVLQVLLEYVRRGASIIRLDAVAFLWKEMGTNCIHLPQTHEVVKLMRDVVHAVAPHVLLLTETNVPHRENVSYFGSGDEAHMVYQFSLPPLLVDAFLNADASVFSRWLAELQPPPEGAAYFNFTASHDGIGVRPLEGLVPRERFDRLVEHVRSRRGLVSMRRMPDGSEVPYELNISYVDVMAPPEQGIDLHARRFLASQGIMLGLAGLPAVYFHSLVGTQNDYAGATQSGQPRRINRRKFELAELKLRLNERHTLQSRIFCEYRRLLACRAQQEAFHPSASQEVVDIGDRELIALLRTNEQAGQKILVVANLSSQPKFVQLSRLGLEQLCHDLLGKKLVDRSGQVVLPPYELAWLANR